MGKSPKCRGVGTDEFDVVVFENVADVAASVLHAGIIPHQSAQYALSPFGVVERYVTCSAQQRRQHFL